jgi:methyl-accepting chemotaxis protein
VETWKNLLLHGQEAAGRDTLLGRFTAAESDVDAALDELRGQTELLQIEPKVVEAIRAAHADWGEKSRKALRAHRDGSSAAAVDNLVLDLDRGLDQQLNAVEAEINRFAERTAKARSETMERNGRWFELLMASGTVAGILAGVVFGLVVSSAVVRHIAAIAGRMWDRTTEVAAASEQMAVSSQTVAQTSSQQAATVHETTSALMQVSGTVKENAERAREAREVSQTNRGAVDQGAGELAEMQHAMQEISAASGNIAKIVKSIDEIAFQTNILALNAAVEAARAGESGAGFAVVADEVRSLAQRSAAAARETAQKIEDATSKSARGAELATRVADSLQRVIGNTRRVAELVEAIAQASAEQSDGLVQAVASMQRIGEMTQSNAGASEQTASAAQSLEAQAEQLRTELSSLVNRRAAEMEQETDETEIADCEKAVMAA